MSALVFAHPDAEYFNVGQVNKDQVRGESARVLAVTAQVRR